MKPYPVLCVVLSCGAECASCPSHSVLQLLQGNTSSMQGCSGLHMQRPCCFRLPQRTHLVVAPVHVRSSRRWTPVQASSAPADSSGSAPGTSNSTQQPDGKDNRPLWERLGLPKSLPFLRRSDSDDEQPHHDGQQWRFSTKTALLYLRTLLYAMIAMVGLTFVRYTATVQARTAPKEVLYSDFVTLLDAGKVRAARLETSNSRLIFEITQDAAAARDATATASTSSSSSSSQGLQLSATGRKHMTELTGQQQATAAAASQGAAVAGENAAAAAATTSSSSSNKRFYIKTAEKQDPFLVSRILQAGEGDELAAGVMQPFLFSSRAVMLVLTACCADCFATTSQMYYTQQRSGQPWQLDATHAICRGC